MEKLFFHILQMSLVSCYCIFAVLGIRFLLRKAPKIFSYLLWFIVFIRLICPVAMESPFSLVPDVITNYAMASSNMMDKSNLTESTGNTVHENTGILKNADQKKNGLNSLQDRKILTKGVIFSFIWLAGFLILLLRNFYKVFMLIKRLKTSKKSYGNIYCSEIIDSPFVMGIIKPRIYLPDHMNENEMNYIIRHESIHIQRKDYLIKTITFLICCLHWFNPLVWLSFMLMSHDMEMSCDEQVVRELGSTIKKEYSKSLLFWATQKSSIHTSSFAFGENDVNGRIKNILGYKKAKNRIIVFVAVLCITAGVCLLTNPKTTAVKNSTNVIEQQEKESKIITEKEKKAVYAWADAFTKRDGNALYELAADKEQFKSWDYVTAINGGKEYAFGDSSPWPWNQDYKIVINGEKADIYYYALTSDPAVTTWKETVVLVPQKDKSYLVDHKMLESYDTVNSKKIFDDAYYINGVYQYYDFKKNSFIDAIGNQLSADKTNTASARVYQDPKTAAENFLHLTGGTASVTKSGEDNMTVRYIFSDGKYVDIPVYKAASNPVVWCVGKSNTKAK